MSKLSSFIDPSYMYEFFGSLTERSDSDFYVETLPLEGQGRVVANGSDEPVVVVDDIGLLLTQLARMTNWLRTLPRRASDKSDNGITSVFSKE